MTIMVFIVFLLSLCLAALRMESEDEDGERAWINYLADRSLKRKPGARKQKYSRAGVQQCRNSFSR